MKKMGKGLIALALSVPLLFGGCADKIEECYYLSSGEKICEVDSTWGYNSYCLTKQNGIIIKYFYSGPKNKPEIQRVEITNDGVIKIYDQKEIIEGAQKQLDKYIKEINQKEIEEGLRLLK